MYCVVHPRIGPLARVFLDDACDPVTGKYNQSLAVYLKESSFANTTLGSMVRPLADTLDDYYKAAVSYS